MSEFFIESISKILLNLRNENQFEKVINEWLKNDENICLP